jgi:hypothetical protein
LTLAEEGRKYCILLSSTLAKVFFLFFLKKRKKKNLQAENVVQEIHDQAVWLDWDHVAGELVDEDHGPQEFCVAAENTGDLLGTIAEGWDDGGHAVGGHPDADDDGALAGGRASGDGEVETTLGEEVTGAVNGNAHEHGLGEVREAVERVGGCALCPGDGEEKVDVEAKSGEIHEALEWDNLGNVLGNQRPNVELRLGDVVVDDVPEEDSDGHVCPELPLTDGDVAEEVLHHESTEGGEDAANDVVGPVSAVGSDRVDQMKSRHEGVRPVGGVDGITTKDAEDRAELVLTVGDVVKSKGLVLLAVEWADAAEKNQGDDSHTKVDHWVVQVNWSA